MKNIEAIFSNENIIIGKVKQPAGIYSKILLNSFSGKNGHFSIEETLEREYGIISCASESMLIPEKKIDTADISSSLIRCLTAIKKLFPFDLSQETDNISLLFSESNINDVNILKCSRQLRTDNRQELWNIYPQLSDSQFVFRTLEAENEMKDCLMFFENLCHDIPAVYSEMKKIADAYSETDKHHEKDLLMPAIELLKNRNMASINTEYVAAPGKDKNEALGRRMIFTSYRDFVIADLFEGIHYGHYVRKCIICGRYFFMTKAYNQQVCDGKTDIPKRYEDGCYSCREYANKTKRKDSAKDDPIKKIYTSRCSQLRRSKSLGNISDEFYKAAVSVASSHKEKASYRAEYAAGQYEKDMTLEAITAETERILKNE